MLDLKAQFKSLEPQIRAAIDRVLESQHFILGPEVEAFEEEIANYLQCKHAIGVSSGSDALIVALMALDIGPGDEVITTPYTFFATVGAIVRLGATPVFVDIQETDFNIDPNLLEEKITNKTKAVIPVHLFGQCADMKPIMEICDQHDIPIIEDAAQAIGSEYQGKRAGSMGLMSCFSFFPAKNLGCFGDGGLVTTNNAELAEKIKVLRAHGSKPKYHHKLVGGNFRMDAIHAAVLREKLKHLDTWTTQRQENAASYDQLFNKTKNIISPWKREGDRHIYNQYVLTVKQDRDKLQAHLKENQIASAIYYPVPMHQQECFQGLINPSHSYPISEKCAQTTLAIPIYPELGFKQTKKTNRLITDFFKTNYQK